MRYAQQLRILNPGLSGYGYTDESSAAAFLASLTNWPENMPLPTAAELELAVGNNLVVDTVTMRQARLALLQSGLLAQVNAAVAAMPGVEGDAARIEWEFSGTVERSRSMVQLLATALGLTEAQLDELFMLAATL